MAAVFQVVQGQFIKLPYKGFEAIISHLWLVLYAEIKRHWIIQWKYAGDSLSWLLFTCLMFVAVVAVLNGVSGDAYGREAQLLVLVGWLAFQVAGGPMMRLPRAISDEAQTGTLEQVCLSPLPLAAILAARSVAAFLSAGARGVVAALMLSLVVGTLPGADSAALILVFLVSALGAYGMGYLFAGLALVFKQTSALTSLVFSLMMLLTGAFVGLEKLGRFFTATKLLFPLTWGISLMRALLSGDATLLSLLQSRVLIGLGLHSVLYLALGLAVFGWGYRTARRQGTLAHY